MCGVCDEINMDSNTSASKIVNIQFAVSMASNIPQEKNGIKVEMQTIDADGRFKTLELSLEQLQILDRLLA